MRSHVYEDKILNLVPMTSAAIPLSDYAQIAEHFSSIWSRRKWLDHEFQTQQVNCLYLINFVFYMHFPVQLDHKELLLNMFSF